MAKRSRKNYYSNYNSNYNPRRDLNRIARRYLPEVSAKSIFSRVSPVDLRIFEDRRTWHPDGYYRGAFSQPRIAADLMSAPPLRVMRKIRSRLNDGRAVSRLAQHYIYNSNFNPSEAISINAGDRIAFRDPKRVTVCVRRHRRREVLFAHGGIGRGKRNLRPPTRNAMSDVSCG